MEHKIQIFYSSSQFQDVPTGLENVNHEEGEIVSQSQEAEKEEGEQAAFIMNIPDGEVRKLSTGSKVSKTFSSCMEAKHLLNLTWYLV